jgi:hypothetical protein
VSDHKVEVVNNSIDHRFEAVLDDNDLAFIDYQIAGKNIIFTHTEVPEKYEGRGIANQLAEVALNYARDNGYKIQAVCPFVDLYIRKHKEYQSITWGY